MVRASVCDVSGATSQSCKVTQSIRNVHDQPEWLRVRPAIVVLCPVEFKTIPQLRILLTSGNSDVIPAASSSPGILGGHFLVVRLTVFLFEFWPRTFTIELYSKLAFQRAQYFGARLGYVLIIHTLVKSGYGTYFHGWFFSKKSDACLGWHFRTDVLRNASLLYEKKSTVISDYDFGVHFSFK